jgi:hypothetical protein
MGRYRNCYTHRGNTITDIDDNVWWEDDNDIILIGDNYYPNDHDDIIFDEINDEYILLEDAVEITKGSKEGKWAMTSETTEDHEGYIWADCDRDVLITEINNNWYNIEDVIEIDGNYYLKDSEEIEYINGIYQLKIEENAE